jgi:hypothetical protein
MANALSVGVCLQALPLTLTSLINLTASGPLPCIINLKSYKHFMYSNYKCIVVDMWFQEITGLSLQFTENSDVLMEELVNKRQHLMHWPYVQGLTIRKRKRQLMVYY